jgi:hypothetical protein
MALPVDLAGLTTNPAEAADISQIVFEASFNRPELNAIHYVDTGVEMDRYIPILGNFGLIGKIDPGGCSSNTETGQIPTSEKEWTPKLISFREIVCGTDVPANFKAWKRARIANKTWEMVNDELMAFIADKTQDAIDRSIIRIAEFGDTTASPIGDATGNQLLTSGTTKTYFNMLNGMWQQIIADGVGSQLMYRYTIAENALLNKTAQMELASDAALNVLRKLYNNIDSRANEGNLTFQITKSLFDNWQDFIEDKSLVFMLTQTEQGSTTWSYRGIPIVVRKDWDRIIKTYFDLGDTYYLPHRAILCDIANIPIGTSDEESLHTFSSIYDPITKKHYLDGAYKLDMKILLEYAMAVAY